MISHNYPDLGVWGLNLGYFAWGCKCSSRLFGARTMFSKKNTCCNPPLGDGMPTVSFCGL